MCRTPEKQYSHRDDWVNHMRQEHWRSWLCPFGCPQTSSTAHGLQQHMRNSHENQTDTYTHNHDLPQVLSSYADPDQANGQCPLCADYQITSEEQYSSHVSGHLETLALLALPNTSTEGREPNDSGGGKYTEEHTIMGNAPEEPFGGLPHRGSDSKCACELFRILTWPTYDRLLYCLVKSSAVRTGLGSCRVCRFADAKNFQLLKIG